MQYYTETLFSFVGTYTILTKLQVITFYQCIVIIIKFGKCGSFFTNAVPEEYLQNSNTMHMHSTLA